MPLFQAQILGRMLTWWLVCVAHHLCPWCKKQKTAINASASDSFISWSVAPPAHRRAHFEWLMQKSVGLVYSLNPDVCMGICTSWINSLAYCFLQRHLIGVLSRVTAKQHYDKQCELHNITFLIHASPDAGAERADTNVCHLSRVLSSRRPVSVWLTEALLNK